MKLMVLYYLLLFMTVTSCVGRRQEKVAETSATENKVDDWSATDSVEIYHYLNPDDQKKFNRVNTSDGELIDLLKKNLQQQDISSHACPHYTKLYLFRDGAVFKTLYISDSCRYLAYVNNGNRVFKQLDTALRNRLKNLR